MQRSQDGPTTPVASASLASRAVFSWVLPLLRLGHTRQLDQSDMWPLEASNACAGVIPSFTPTYAATKSLLRTFVRLHGRRFALIGLAQLLLVPCTLYGPYVLHQVLSTLESPEEEWSSSLLWTTLGSLFLIQVTAALLSAHTDYLDKVLVVRLTAGLQHLLFEKTLRLDATCRKRISTGDLTNYFTSDINAILRVTFYIHYLWLMPLQIVITLVLLYKIISWATFVGVAILVLGAPITNVLVKLRYRAMDTLMAQKDARMRFVHEVVGAIQILKLQAAEDAVLTKLLALRVKEVQSLRRLFALASATISMAYIIPATVTVASLATYTLLLRQDVTVAKVFGALALFNSLSTPLNNFPHTLTSALTGLVSVRRLDAFLALPERPVDNVQTPTTLSPDQLAPLATDKVAIAIDDGAFGWDHEKPIFTDLNLRIHQGELVVVHGLVGEGKSSLCSILLGELDKLRGSVFVGGRVSYFSQQAWIQNMTIRENILFGKPYDRKKYAAVIDACALTKDLAALPAGDRTEIGQKGVNLSGGQKARIALARACYNDGDVFLLDSPLSAVDAIVSNEIFTKCFLGLLSKKTVLLVTHNPEIIASKHVDRTIEIANGICKQTINTAKEAFDSALSPLAAHPKVVYSKGDAEYQASEMRVESPMAATSPIGATETHRLIQAEARSEGRVSPRVFANYMRAAGGPGAVLLVLFVQMTWQTVVVGRDLWLSHWASSPEMQANAGFGICVYAGLCVVVALLVVCRVLSISVAGRRASRVLFEDMARALYRAPMTFFDTTPAGRILNRFSGDVTKVDLDVTFTYTFFIGTLSGFLLSVTTSIVAMGWYALALVPLLYLYYMIGRFYIAPARDVERLSKVASSPMLQWVAETIDGAVVVRAFGHEHRFAAHHAATVDHCNTTVLVRQVLQQWLLLQTQLLSALLVLVITAALIGLRDTLSPGWIGIVFNYALGIPGSLQYLIQDSSDLEIAMVGPERIIEYTQIPPEAPRVIPGAVSTQSWPSQGAITFENVSFRYKENDPLVLKDVSVALRGREKVGIVGRTGAGKSSLTMALFRINELAAGSISIDGINCASVGLKTLRESIAIIPQNPVLFKGTLRQYLDPFDQFQDDDLWNVLRKVNLVERIEKDGLSSDVEENGENFSVGERQMLCMARALLLRAKVVVMDEATAAMDHATDQKLQHVIRTAFADSTVLTIAHRLDTVLDCDRILVLDHGRLVQSDSPSNLIAQGDGIFFELCSEGGYLDKVHQATTP
ncbi:hypothetical protein SPRG_14434 [Saprolegnia parasitica CBS 223.65]|uniref:Multidrug resistance-associated protein 1 n=1 Tax=Saprolegnia parasitica (strain CBS 223.65) TaxID=695850 RepID=A0A067BP93_SAPPC|nr:hypothetical protein SPRG_14434 [Saprolegnia parasitica CBS 223.65]KDO20299.1 hypothetical protein SPRG_14434 [Saprolegnia parasitica CBS 223.65]|eukprot:XP_012208969.1 hypothetical protein SPRG_14434 [Saprolegnia parasitica CBS 223.65]